MKRLLLIFALLSLEARANVCGTDYQNFNPTTGGLDFVTVHSSETLRPCIINMGLFFNYAANNLTFGQGAAKGERRQDKVLGMDLSAGMGLTDKWDFGVNVPFVVSQTLEDDTGVSSFSKKGATEFKANTKYHFYGDENGGVAGVLSVNKNLIRNNPFSGQDPGLTVNYELVADTTINTKWAAAINAGYRDRKPGSQVAGVPFVPLDDQWIYSVAGSYLIPEKDTKLIFEIFGSHAAKRIASGSDRNLNTLEALAGVKYDYNDSVALHFGGATLLDPGLGGPDWRVYAGLNWVVGPVCKTNVFESFKDSFGNGPEVYTVDIRLLFETNSDQIRPDRLAKFDETYQKVFSRGYQRMEIEGHTDSVGDAKYNLDLSQRRANFVRNHIVKKYGVTAAKIEAKGIGEERPIADNGNYQGRQKNRRVEFKIWR